MPTRIIITGRKNDGKSTLAQRLVSDNRPGTFPTVIECDNGDFTNVYPPNHSNWILTTQSLSRVPDRLRQGAVVMNAGFFHHE